MPEIRIQIEGDDADAGSKPAGRPAESIEDIERRAAEHRAEAARANHETARLRAEGARMRLGNAQIEAESHARAAQAEYRNALEIGDVDGQTTAQARMAEIEARRVRLEEQAAALERSPVLQHADPVEALCANRTEPTARWLREHREWVLDPRKSAKVSAAHFDAVAEGLREDTPEYFQHIEHKIGLDGNSRSGGDRGGARPPAKYDPSNVHTHIRSGGSEVILTKGEKEAATNGTLIWNYGPNRGKPIGVAEFAKRKVQMAKDGYYDKLDG
jgi:hypothetical protein